MLATIRIETRLGPKEKWDHFLFRWGYKRSEHLVAPGLYSVGEPSPESPVFVSANLTLSFDALRSSLDGMSAYVLVLDTKGINVWCAAGKGTFGTEEVIKRIKDCELDRVVSHRKVILPQLAAPGVNALDVKKGTGFQVQWGPVRAKDIPEYMRQGKATPEMRKVTFTLRERAVLVPVEIVHTFLYMAFFSLLAFLLGGLVLALAAVAVILGGVALFPLLLPFLPTHEFSSKGTILGILLSLPFSLYSLTLGHAVDLELVVRVLAFALLMAPWVSFLALNFTGCSTYTSRTGVRKEIFRWIPVMAIMFVAGVVLGIVSHFAGMGGVL
ncbi:MAG: mercury methylation corrinoid protein HgcA [Methanomassiliicoccales archaeon]|nr:mercury methylation corrinoid protein HgcA [Methanomassiliicoccales archaeon]